MSENFYRKNIEYMNRHPKIKKMTVYIGKVITYFIYIYYFALLGYTFFVLRDSFLRVLLIPAISFAILSIIRYFINAPRPYEKYSIAPLYNKKTRGKSFPSRHTFSAFIISFASAFINIYVGIVVFALGVILAVTRVLCGVHFIKDVLAGLAFAIISGLFFLI